MVTSTKLARHLTYDHVSTPFRFNESSPHVPKLRRFLYNCRRGEIANNETIGLYGKSVHTLATRLAITNFVFEHTDLGVVEMAYAIEYLTFAFTHSDNMAREVVSGVDFKIIQLSPGEKADIRTWMKNRRSKCPKTLVDLTQAVYWAAESIHGLDAIVEHTYNNLFAAFQVAFDDFDVQWQSLGELGCLREIQARLVEEHSQRPNALHIADFAHKFSLTPANNRKDVFAPIKDSLLSQCVSPFDANGALCPRYFFLSQFGFAVIDYYVGKELDCVHPEYRASISGGAHFGMTLRDIVLCDETLAHIADEIELCDFPPNCSHQTKAQVLTAAVGQCFNDNFQSNERALSLAIGVLVYMAYDVIRRLDSELLPKMPAITPYSMDPLPYYDDTTPLEFSLPRDQASTPSLLPSVIPSSSSWPSVVASLASTSVSFMSNIREAAKGLLPKPF